MVKGGSVKLPAAEREGYIFKGWYTDRQVFIGTEERPINPAGASASMQDGKKADKDGQDDRKIQYRKHQAIRTIRILRTKT